MKDLGVKITVTMAKVATQQTKELIQAICVRDYFTAKGSYKSSMVL